MAEKLSIKLTGTIGLLTKAESKGIIKSSYKIVLELKKIGFRISDDILEALKEKSEK